MQRREQITVVLVSAPVAAPPNVAPCRQGALCTAFGSPHQDAHVPLGARRTHGTAAAPQTAATHGPAGEPGGEGRAEGEKWAGEETRGDHLGSRAGKGIVEAKERREPQDLGTRFWLPTLAEEGRGCAADPLSKAPYNHTLTTHVVRQ